MRTSKVREPCTLRPKAAMGKDEASGSRFRTPESYEPSPKLRIGPDRHSCRSLVEDERTLGKVVVGEQPHRDVLDVLDRSNRRRHGRMTVSEAHICEAAQNPLGF